MKKFIMLLVAAILILAISAVSFAAGEVGGNLRVWFKTNADGNNNSSFVLDRLQLKVGASFNDNSGFTSLTNVFYKADALVNGIVVDRLYYYQKNLLTADELDVGYIPLYLYYNIDSSISLIGNLAVLIAPIPTNTAYLGSPGLKYNVKFDGFEANLAVLDANDGTFANSSTAVTGYEEYLRLVVRPVDGLAIAAGYFNDNGGKNNLTPNANDTYLTADVTYAFDPVKIYVEYDSRTLSGGTAQNGIYLEGQFKLVDNFTAYLGGTLSSETSGLQSSEYYLAGVKIQASSQAAWQVEYLTYPDAAGKNSLNARLRVDF